MITKSSLHHYIIEYFIEHGYAPGIDLISQELETSLDEVAQCLKDLEEDHGIVLHPRSSKIWVMHPFSTAPTLFSVESGKRRWWGNCAWCSLGIAALVDHPVTIHTTSGGEGNPVKLTIKGNQVDHQDYVVHFPIPMQKAWDNVIYTCSTMLLFQRVEEVDIWCKRYFIPKGDVQPVHKIWPFARDWYGKHRSADWRKWTTEEASKIFRRHGLDHPIWNLPDSPNRF